MKTVFRFGISMVVMAFMAGPAAAAEVVANTSFVLPSGERVLQHQAVVGASLAAVWKAYTTSEGLRSFVAPFARIDFRPGGIWEASYDPKAKLGDPGNIRNKIVTYLPMKMIVMRIAATPPDFPHPEVAKSVWTILELEDLGFDRVRVIGSMVGWKPGPESDEVYRFFEKGNADVLAALQRRFVEGPNDWSATPGKPRAGSRR